MANGAGTPVSEERRLRLDGTPVNRHLGVSAFANHAVVSRRPFVKIERDIPFEVATFFGCAAITGVGSVVNTSKVHPGSTAAVLGRGNIGLNTLLDARLAGARQIVAIDMHEDKPELARQLGATDTFVTSEENCVATVKETTGGGVDYASEMGGSAKALELAWNITCRGGETVSAGLRHPHQRFSILPVHLVAEERTLPGSYLGGCVPVRDIPNFVKLYRLGQLPIDRLMTETVNLNDINDAFERVASGEMVRSVMTP